MHSAIPVPAPKDSIKGLRALAIVAAAGLAVTAAAAFLSFPLPSCPFRTLAHLPCPGCGMTRSLGALWHGDCLLSFRYHPLGLPAFAGAIICVSLPLAPRSIQQRLTLSPAAQRFAALVVLAALLSVWLLRLILILSGSDYFLW